MSMNLSSCDGATHQVFGMELPVLAELLDGYLLVAHKNGPAVTNSPSGLWMLDCMADADDECGISQRVRTDAIRAYRELTWPRVVGRYFDSVVS